VAVSLDVCFTAVMQSKPVLDVLKRSRTLSNDKFRLDVKVFTIVTIVITITVCFIGHSNVTKKETVWECIKNITVHGCQFSLLPCIIIHDYTLLMLSLSITLFESFT